MSNATLGRNYGGICLTSSTNTLDRHFDFDAVHSEKSSFSFSLFIPLLLFALLSAPFFASIAY